MDRVYVSRCPDNPVRENANKPIIRLASAPESIMERRPWRSIEDPERAGVFPFQPVSISPWQKNASLERELVVPNGSEDHDCDPMRVVAPYLDGTRVYTRFEAICEIPGPEEEMKDTKWTIKLRLKSPTGGRQTTHEYEIGKNVTFDESNTITSLACKPGEWQARAEFWVKLKHEWKGTRIYFNNRYTDITCP